MVFEMNEVITIQGIRELQKKNRLDWPDNWKELIDDYLDKKMKMILVKRKRGMDTTYEESLLMEVHEFLKKVDLT